MVRHIPNTLTLANLFCGCLGIVQVFGGDLQLASYLILLAAVFDFLDGFMAKLLKAASAIGRDLDSLADMVTFGLLPSCMVYSMMVDGFERTDPGILSYTAFTIAIFSALRLARFNNDPRQSDRFIGLPTPANTLLIASLPFIRENGGPGADFLANPWVLLVFSLAVSFMLVAEIPLLALKFKGFQWQGNQARYLLLLFSVILLVVFNWAAVPLITVVYIVISLADNLLNK